MKRLLPVFTLALLLLMLLATPALAIEDTYNGKEVFEPDNAGQYTITHNDAAISAEGQYLLLIVKGLHDDWDDYLGENSGITISDVTYVDQTTAESGKVSYSGLIPYVQPNSTVFVSGDAYSQPELVGYIGAGTISFSVTHLQPGQYIKPTVSLVTTEYVDVSSPSGTTALQSTVYATVYEATYDLKITKPGYLSVEITDIPIDAEFDLTDIQLYGGDIVVASDLSKSSVNFEDLTAFLDVYAWNDANKHWSNVVDGNLIYAYADINESNRPNGYICNFEDLTQFLVSYGKSAISMTYAEWLAGGNL